MYIIIIVVNVRIFTIWSLNQIVNHRPSRSYVFKRVYTRTDDKGEKKLYIVLTAPLKIAVSWCILLYTYIRERREGDKFNLRVDNASEFIENIIYMCVQCTQRVFNAAPPLIFYIFTCDEKKNIIIREK